MLSVALKGLAQRKLRAVLTGLAVIIGVAMITGTYVLTDTISNAFGSIYQQSYKGADAVVTPKTIVHADNAGTPTIPASELQRISARPDVAAASGQVADDTGARLTNRAGKPIDTKGAPSLAFGLDADQPQFSLMSVDEGRLARGPNEVVIDEGTASDNSFHVGDTIGIQIDGATRPFTISGTGSFGGASIGSATVAAFDVSTAQKLLGRGDAFDQISVKAAPGVSASELTASIARDLPPTVQVRSGADQAQAESDDASGDLSFVNYFLLAFAAIALFVGSFVIFNTLSITVAQRTRELATMRTLGASRRQVMRGVIAEATVVGLGSSIVGILAGIGLAKGLNALFVALGADLPTAGMVLATRTIVVSLLVGTLVTVAASVLPARRASRVAPVTAVREGSELPRTSLSRRAPVAGAAIGIVGAAGLATSLLADMATRPRIILMIVGLLATFVGIAALMPRIVRPLTRVIGGPVARLGGQSGRLGTENAMRNPGRTASTAAALMIGLALMTFVAVLGTGLKASDRNALADQISATHVISKSTGFENLTPGTDRAAATATGAEIVSGVRSASVKVGTDEVAANGVDPATIVSLYRFDWDRGSNAVLASLSGNQAIVSHDFAKDRNLVVGSSFTVQSASGATGTLRVAGTYTPKKLDSLMSPVVMTQTAFDSLVPRASDSLVLARMAGGDQAGVDSLTAALGAYPDGSVQTSSAFVEERAQDIDTLLNLLYVLLALSVVVSMFGMVNTLALAVIERTREIGLLRAVGMSRRQVRRMIRSESVTTALIGAVMGLPIGIGLAALVTRALGDYDVGFSLPVTGLLTLTWLAIGAGILAAVAPGRRAARLDVLRALQYE